MVSFYDASEVCIFDMLPKVTIAQSSAEDQLYRAEVFRQMEAIKNTSGGGTTKYGDNMTMSHLKAFLRLHYGVWDTKRLEDSDSDVAYWLATQVSVVILYCLPI